MTKLISLKIFLNFKQKVFSEINFKTITSIKDVKSLRETFKLLNEADNIIYIHVSNREISQSDNLGEFKAFGHNMDEHLFNKLRRDLKEKTEFIYLSIMDAKNSLTNIPNQNLTSFLKKLQKMKKNKYYHGKCARFVTRFKINQSLIKFQKLIEKEFKAFFDRSEASAIVETLLKDKNCKYN